MSDITMVREWRGEACYNVIRELQITNSSIIQLVMDDAQKIVINCSIIHIF